MSKRREDDALYLEAEDLMVLFRYKTLDSFYHAVRRGNFPIPTYKVGRRIVADREAVRLFFAEQRARGVEAVTELFSGD